MRRRGRAPGPGLAVGTGWLARQSLSGHPATWEDVRWHSQGHRLLPGPGQCGELVSSGSPARPGTRLRGSQLCPLPVAAPVREAERDLGSRQEADAGARPAGGAAHGGAAGGGRAVGPPRRGRGQPHAGEAQPAPSRQPCASAHSALPGCSGRCGVTVAGSVPPAPLPAVRPGEPRHLPQMSKRQPGGWAAFSASFHGHPGDLVFRSFRTWGKACEGKAEVSGGARGP